MNHQERLDSVRERIRKACAQSGRTEESVTLIAVSKTKPWEDIAAFAKLGVKDFGENYVRKRSPSRKNSPAFAGT
ncbi:MAG: hypothetical protein ACXVCK_13360 [Bdellovibrionota bacterium]